MTQKVAYTTVLGRTDPLHDPVVDTGDWRFVCFTDQPGVKSTRWEVIQVPATQTPTRECRKLKLNPFRVFWDAEVTLWLDCCLTLLMPPDELLEQYPQDFVAFRHHRRDRISQETEAIIRAGKAKTAEVRRQLAAYQKAGWDTERKPQSILHNGGFLLRRNTELVNRHADLWDREVQTRTLRDQMSIDFTAHRAGLEIRTFKGTIPRNDYVRIKHYDRPPNDF